MPISVEPPLDFQALLLLPQQNICLNDSNKIQDRPQGWSRPEHEVVSISLCCTETTATTRGVLTGCLRKNKRSHNGLWVQFKMIAWYKGHGLSNQKACCFASVFISAILKWVKEHEALNTCLINKALSQPLVPVLNCPFPALRAAFQTGPLTYRNLWSTTVFKKGKWLAAWSISENKPSIFKWWITTISCPTEEKHISLCASGVLKGQSQFSLTGHRRSI